MAEHRKARFQQSTAQLNGMTAFLGKYDAGMTVALVLLILAKLTP